MPKAFVVYRYRDCRVETDLPIPYDIEARCPKCKVLLVHELQKDGSPLFRLKIGEPDSVWLLCSECDDDFEVPVKLTITLEAL